MVSAGLSTNAPRPLWLGRNCSLQYGSILIEVAARVSAKMDVPPGYLSR